MAKYLLINDYPLLGAFASAFKRTIIEQLKIDGKCSVLSGGCNCPKCQIADMNTEELVNLSIDHYGKSFNWKE